MDLRQGIIETANSLGMNPADLATIISFETGGTFNPTQKGPTTKWGTHRGLIQFGEPQAKQYGVDWNNPIASQLGPNGAIAKYYRANGWKPGMGIMDAYSIVNAGGPGLYNRSDTAAGGTWGSVADKVNHQFGPHYKKAEAMLGGNFKFPNVPAMGNPTVGSGVTPGILQQLVDGTSVMPEMISQPKEMSNFEKMGLIGAMMEEQSPQAPQAPAPPPRSGGIPMPQRDNAYANSLISLMEQLYD